MEAGGIEPPCKNNGTDSGRKSCGFCQGCCAAPALHFGGSGRQFLAAFDPELKTVIDGWVQLPAAVKTAVTMLIRANVADLPEADQEAQDCLSDREGLAMQIAQGCRYIIQGCLREEEWQDADEEFCAVITSHLSRL